MKYTKISTIQKFPAIRYIPTLAFLDYFAPINVDVFVECGSYVSCRLFPSCHDNSGLSILIQSHYYWLFLHTSKSKHRDV